MKDPLITIITVCYNCINTIEQTIKSVLVQDYEHIEYIIIDGGSTDGTVEIIKKHSSQISKWISEPDKGIYDAMNKGIGMASGDWIHFRNSGDYFLSIHTISDVFRNGIPEDVAVVHGDCYYVYPGYYTQQKPAILSIPFNQDMPVLHPATFVRTCYHKEMLFDLRYKSSSDYNFFYGLCKKGVIFLYIPIVVATFEIGGFSSNWERTFWEDRRIQEKMNTFSGRAKVFIEFIRRKLWWRYRSKKCLQENDTNKILGIVKYDY